MGAIDEEKKSNKERLDGLKNNFTNLKREIQRIETAENTAKEQVEEAMKQKNQFDEHCKKMRARVKENRDKYKA